MTTDFSISGGFPEDQRKAAALLFWQAFSGKLGKILAPEQKALRLIERILDPTHAICALGPEGNLIGMAGFKSPEGAFVDGTLKDMTAEYGHFGGLWRGLLLDFLERKTEPDILLMDGIFVDEAARGSGVGTALLEAICSEAHRQKLSRVRLDVIDTNPRAKALYGRFGFQVISREETGPFKHLFGFSAAARMEKQVFEGRE
jgi:ribosomal protein S18 acetylase RimI-like enzyme